MAFGIDDIVMTFAAGINLTDTVVETVERYRQAGVQAEFELLLQEIRIAAIDKINGADLALAQFQRLLKDKGVNINQPLAAVINETRQWTYREQWKVGDIRKYFNDFSDSVYSACDSIAALTRCSGQTRELGEAVVASASRKHELLTRLLNSNSYQSD